MLVIGSNHGRAARLDQLGEQPELGREIASQGRMIVEMVAAEIGEGAGRDTHAVESALIEPVRGGFDGEMRHALAGEFVRASGAAPPDPAS